MEEKKINREPLKDEELSDVNGGYNSVAGSVMPNLENTVNSGSYATARASVGVHVGAVNEAGAIQQAVPVDVSVNTPQHAHTLNDASIGLKWNGNDL